MAHPADDIVARIAQRKALIAGTAYTVVPQGMVYGVKNDRDQVLVSGLTQAEANAVKTMLDNALATLRDNIEQAAYNDVVSLVQDWGALVNG